MPEEANRVIRPVPELAAMIAFMEVVLSNVGRRKRARMLRDLDALCDQYEEAARVTPIWPSAQRAVNARLAVVSILRPAAEDWRRKLTNDLAG